MIEIYPDNRTSRPIGRPEALSGTLLGKLLMPVTRYCQMKAALPALRGCESHLDIGCGDCYFLLNSPGKVRVGLDLRFGDEVVDRLEFPDGSFAGVSMLAVIEHLENPAGVIREVHRVLKPGGRFIITTPKRKGEWLMGLLRKDISHIHKAYFDLETIQELTGDFFELISFKEFLLGFNQIFVMQKL